MESDKYPINTDNPEIIAPTADTRTPALLNTIRQVVVASNEDRRTGTSEEGWRSFTVGNVIFGYSVTNGVQANISRLMIDELLADYEVKISILGDITITKIQYDSRDVDLDHSDPSFNKVLSYLDTLIIGYNESN